MHLSRPVLAALLCLLVCGAPFALADPSRTHTIEADGTVVQIQHGPAQEIQIDQGDRRSDYIWRSTRESMIGSSVGVSRWAGNYDVMVGHENAPPTPVEVFEADGEGTPYWTETAELAQVASRMGYFALADFTEPAGIALTCWDQSLSAPLWTHDLPGCLPAHYSNTLRINMDGTRVCYGCYSDGLVRLVVLAVPAGTVLVDTIIDLDTPSLRNMSVSDDGRFVDLNCGAWHVVYDVAANAERGRVNVQASTNPCGISETGEWIVSGFNTTKAFQWDPDQQMYVQRWLRANAGHYVGVAMVSEQGFWISGWYSSSYNKNRIMRVSLFDGTPDWTLDLPVSQGSVQDLPSAIDYTRNRDLIAFGFWGDTGPASPEILVIDANANEQYSSHAPGSMYDVAIAENGSYVAATGKLVHANTFGSGSDAYCGQASAYADVDPNGHDRVLRWVAYPNPSVGMTTIQAETPSSDQRLDTTLRVLDATGRVVRTLTGVAWGTSLITRWDGRDDFGTLLPAGVYYGSPAQAGSGEAGSIRILRVR